MASISTKQGQPSTYSPGTLASSRRRLGNFLAGIANLGSPLRSTTVRSAPADSSGEEVIEGESPLKAKVYRKGKVDSPHEEVNGDQDDLWLAASGRRALRSAPGQGDCEESLSSSVKRNIAVVDSAVDISANEGKRSFLLELPDDLILTIFQYLPLSPNQLRTLSLVSHRLGSISQSPILWSQLYRSTPGFHLSPLTRDRLEAVPDPPRGKWDGTDWVWDEPLSQDMSLLSLSSTEDTSTSLSSDRIPVHYPTLYRSRLAFSHNIRHPSPIHRTRTEIISEHTDAVYTIRTSGHWLFTGSRDKSIRIWRLGAYNEYGQPGQTRLIKGIPDAHTGSVLCLSVDIDLSGKGQIISGSSDHTTRLWSVDLSDPSSPKINLESTIRGHNLAVLDIALTPEYIITASKDTTVRVYSRLTLEVKHVWEDHERAVNAIAVSPDQKSVVSASGSGMWIVRDLDSGEMVRKGGGKQGQLGGVACIAWKGKYIVTGSSDRKITIYDADSKDPSSTEVIKICVGHTDMVRAVDISLEEGWVLSGSYDGSVRLWDLKTGILIRNFSTIDGSFIFDVQSTLTRLFIARQNNTFDIISLVTGLPYLNLMA